jgi:SSS family solute:Na+ symporter
MSIGAANLFASNIIQSFRARQARPATELGIARYVALLVLAGAFCLAVFVKPAFAINFQLLGGAWILQIFPAVILGLYTRRLHPAALLAGWVSGMIAATSMAVSTNFSPLFPLHAGAATVIGAIVFYSLLVNLIVTVGLSWALNAAKADAGSDLTTAADYG